MLGFVQSWFKPGANPIGVDFGSDTLRLAQVERVEGAAAGAPTAPNAAATGGTPCEFRLVAAASADVPSDIRNDVPARIEWFGRTVRELLASGNFRGRRAVLALPASVMHIQHLRVPKMDEAELKKALPFEAAGKLPIDPAYALMRHLVAGEVYQEQEPRNEVIVMAAARELVNQFLAAAARGKLDVVGMNVEPKALTDCFTHVYRRKTDEQTTNCFVDVGWSGSRAVVARGGQILFARVIPVGGQHFSQAVAAGLKMNPEDAKLLRIKLAQVQASAPAAPAAEEPREAQQRRTAQPPAPVVPSEENSFALLGAAVAASNRRNSGNEGGGTATATAPVPAPVAVVAAPQAAPAALPDDVQQELQRVERACADQVSKLAEELSLCRRYHEAAFPNFPIDRLVFVGGEARHRSLCQQIARKLGLAAQLGDPMARMARISEIGPETGIDRRQPQPAWAVAVGLSMGPPDAPNPGK